LQLAREQAKLAWSALASDLTLIGLFAVIDEGVPFDDDFALLAVRSKFCEASVMLARVTFRELAADHRRIVTLFAVISKPHTAFAGH
jgi:hypothetical protein